MNKIALVLMMSMAPGAFAAEASTYAMVLGQYVSGDIDTCTGNCDADTSKDSSTFAAGVGLQYGPAILEIPISPDGIGANVIFRMPVGRHTIGVGGGVMRLSYDVDFAPGTSGTVDGTMATAFLDYTGKLTSALSIVVRAGAQTGELTGHYQSLYSSRIDQSGWFTQAGIQYSAK